MAEQYDGCVEDEIIASAHANDAMTDELWGWQQQGLISESSIPANLPLAQRWCMAKDMINAAASGKPATSCVEPTLEPRLHILQGGRAATGG